MNMYDSPLESPASPPRLSRNRRTRGRGLRTTSGCTTCRKRHLKCDEVKPVCSQCKKAKKSCAYSQLSAPRTRTAASRGQRERSGHQPHDNLNDNEHGDESTTITEPNPSKLHDGGHQSQLGEDGDDLTPTASPQDHRHRYENRNVGLAWEQGACHSGNTGDDMQQQEQPQPQQSLDQLVAIIAAENDSRSTSSPFQQHAHNAAAHSLSTSGSITSPGPTVNAATNRWFGLLAQDAARGTHEISAVLDGAATTASNGNEEDENIRAILSIAAEENLDPSLITPLQRATRIVDQQQPLGAEVAAGGDNNSAHLQPFEEQLWQSEKSIQLLPREYLFFEHFVRAVSQWIDLFDPTCKFASFVPHLAMRNAGLLNAILALSCRHISLNPIIALSPEIANVDDRSYRDLALQYYYQTLHYVQKAMQYSSYKTSPELLATTLIISTYEMLNDSSKDWERHLEGVFLIQRSQVIHGESGGIKSAVWWAWLRQDIWAAFREKRKTWTFWTPKKPYTALTPFEIAVRSVYVTAKVIDYCSQEAMNSMDLQARVDQASHLSTMLDEWEQHLTVEFSPLPTMVRRESFSVFSPIWICAPAFAVAIQVHCVGQILLCVHEPCMGGSIQFIKRQSTVKHCIDIICGISITLSDDASSLMASQCLYIAGMFTQDVNERNRILELLETRRKRTGWPVNPLGDELRQLWSTKSMRKSEGNSPF